jgi:transcriptional regulator with XRE-family HTH domain
MEKKAVRKVLSAGVAAKLKKARTRSGHSQYSLAEALGWPRAKIKRLEKAEVKTISLEDLRAWNAATSNVKESSSKKAAPKKSSSSEGKVISLFKVGEMFSNVRHLPLRSLAGGKNVLFFEVTMAKDMTAEQLLRVRKVELLGVTGSINGVENTQDQNPIRAGDRVPIMLWGMGIGEGVRDLNDKARRARRRG